jgi:hypothetical protein
VRTGINARTIADRRRPSIFQEQENAVYRLAAGRGPNMVGGYGGVREGVPSEGRLVTRCLFGDGQEGLQRG